MQSVMKWVGTKKAGSTQERARYDADTYIMINFHKVKRMQNATPPQHLQRSIRRQLQKQVPSSEQQLP